MRKHFSVHVFALISFAGMVMHGLLPALLLTLTSLIFLYSRVLVYMSPEEVIRPLMVFWFVLFILFPPAYWITRNRDWTGILLVIVVLGLFSSTTFAYTYSITILAIFAFLWPIYRFLLKREPGMKPVFIVLNTVSLVGLTLSSLFLLSLLDTIPSSYYSSTSNEVHSGNYVELDSNREGKPDIYFIILDGYGRADILQQLYDFDNSEFIHSLKKKGFIVPANSHSNYPKTAVSVASTLNMDYIESFTPQLKSSIMWWLMAPWLDHSLVRTSLEKAGYRSVSISTDWSISDNPTTDYYFSSHPINLSDFDRYLLDMTPLQILEPAIQDLASVPTFGAHRRSELNNFNSLLAITAIPGPKFVFAHIILPHPPFVFSSDGTPVDPDYRFSFSDGDSYPGTAEDYRDGYVGQVRFLNSRIEPVIESILKNSRQPPIILLLADHGPGMLTEFASAANTCLPERFSIFSAYYLPDMPPGKVPDDITSVNLFRIIFDQYFNANLPLLENAQFFPIEADSIYDMENVTPNVDSRANCSLK